MFHRQIHHIPKMTLRWENECQVWLGIGWASGLCHSPMVPKGIGREHRQDLGRSIPVQSVPVLISGRAAGDCAGILTHLAWTGVRFDGGEFDVGHSHDLSPGLHCGCISAGNAPECARFTNVATGDTIGSAIDGTQFTS
jgi:hypothetical protein